MARKARNSLTSDVHAKLPQPSPAVDSEQVTQRQEGDVLEARSTSRRIKTVEDLLRHIEADMARYEVAASEATKWECASSDGQGGTTVTELHRVFVRLRPKAGPSVAECVQSMIDGAAKSLRAGKAKAAKRQPQQSVGLWQVLVIADTHFGKYAWAQTTGHDDYDLRIAQELVTDAGMRLLDVGDTYKPVLRTVAFLGDLFHYDTPGGTTTSGTPLERDGRLQKMLEVGCETLLSLVARSAETVPTEVLTINGNHDETLTWAFQRILLERFRQDTRVQVHERFTGRQYQKNGRNLLGFVHGHKAKRRLPQIMALESASEWSQCPYREWHTGHYHSQAAEWQRPIETLDGVIVRTAPAICPPDDWHSVHGFIGARQAMETFIYVPDGGLMAMHIAGPKKGTT